MFYLLGPTEVETGLESAQSKTLHSHRNRLNGPQKVPRPIIFYTGIIYTAIIFVNTVNKSH